MSLESVKNYLKKYNMDNRILEFENSSATVEKAARELNCSEERIAKTLSFELDSKSILIVVAGNMKIDNSKYKKEFNKKAKMFQSVFVLERIGHPVGVFVHLM